MVLEPGYPQRLNNPVPAPGTTAGHQTGRWENPATAARGTTRDLTMSTPEATTPEGPRSTLDSGPFPTNTRSCR
jgi:hypothetical protein